MPLKFHLWCMLQHLDWILLDPRKSLMEPHHKMDIQNVLLQHQRDFLLVSTQFHREVWKYGKKKALWIFGFSSCFWTFFPTHFKFKSKALSFGKKYFKFVLSAKSSTPFCLTTCLTILAIRSLRLRKKNPFEKSSSIKSWNNSSSDSLKVSAYAVPRS